MMYYIIHTKYRISKREKMGKRKYKTPEAAQEQADWLNSYEPGAEHTVIEVDEEFIKEVE